MPDTEAPHAPLLIDIAGTALNADDRRRLCDPLVGGLIYFSRNWQSRSQITALSAEIKALRPDLLICVDHEGGRVQRFRTDGFTHLPSMRSLGEHWARSSPGPSGVDETCAMQAMDKATAVGYLMGAELRASGIDFTLAPVLDLDWGPSSVIGDRAFHRDPRVVATLAKSVMHGLLQAGMQHCGKHFPGHGHAAADSHTHIAVDDRPLDAILKDDAAPYGWLKSTLAAVMPAHVVYPQVDARPAGFSRIWLQDILRERLGFDGAIISDDLSMQAARQLAGRTLNSTEAAQAAIEAGCDLVLLCNQSLGGGADIDAVLQTLHATPPPMSPAESELGQAASSRARCRALLPVGAALTWDLLPQQARYLHAKESLASLMPAA